MTAVGTAALSPRGHRFHPTVLREYDIRGIIGETLFAADARALGQAYATLLRAEGGRRACLGFDGRLSSPELAEALGEGLRAGGVDVLWIGRGPTPMLYFAVHHLNADGGLQVTGSHNPPDHNGFKMMLGLSSLYGTRIQELGRIAASGAFATGAGRLIESPVFDAYVERLLRDFRGGRELAVVWDAGNGATGEVLTALTKRLPGRHSLLFAEIDGHFPNHHPDPTIPENLEDLIRAVRAGGAELGIAFDGDGDRIGVVDGQGRIMFGDQMMQILAAEVLARHPGSPILADVKASQALFDEIARLGGKPVMSKTGHSLMKAAMAEMGAPLAGEMSGHIFYADGFYGHDDALYVAIRLLSILTRSDQDPDGMAGRHGADGQHARAAFRLPGRGEVPGDPEGQGKARGRRRQGQRDRRRARDDCKTAGGCLRASNTQAVLVARAEAANEASLARLKHQIAANLKAAGVTPPAF